MRHREDVLTATAIAQSATNPLSGLVLRERDKPQAKPGWSVVRVVASSLNMHDLWTLRGVGHPPERLPIVLGCDAAGYDEEGHEVMVHLCSATRMPVAVTRRSTRTARCFLSGTMVPSPST